MSLERYKGMIREVLVGRREFRVGSGRTIDRVVGAYWEGSALRRDATEVGGRLVAGEGERVAVAVWTEMTLGETGLLERVARAQSESGAYFVVGRGDNLETAWYWELVMLHAVATAGVKWGSTPLLRSARRAAGYHLSETQPDHATSEPWGVNAFLLSEETWPLADQVLHTVRVQHPGGVDGVTGILLADTLRGLEGGGG